MLIMMKFLFAILAFSIIVFLLTAKATNDDLRGVLETLQSGYVSDNTLINCKVAVVLDSFVHTVDERFISITLDTELIQEHWPCFDFR